MLDLLSRRDYMPSRYPTDENWGREESTQARKVALLRTTQSSNYIKAKQSEFDAVHEGGDSVIKSFHTHSWKETSRKIILKIDSFGLLISQDRCQSKIPNCSLLR